MWLNSKDPFFLENTMILGRDLKNLRMIPSKDFFFKEHFFLSRKVKNLIGIKIEKPRISDKSKNHKF